VLDYYVAQLLSQEGLTCAVLGTGNKDEDGYLAYFCKAGDGVVDIQVSTIPALGPPFY
jgi:NAD+ synthase (glutamine-hydrolysing)